MAPMIVIDRVTKEYRIGAVQARYGTLRDAMTNLVAGSVRRLTGRGADRPTIKALDEVSITIERGETVGIIGRNGAGKSTLLKILSRITAPTEGRALLHGRLASLLEVGTGFHPELTGRENVYLNGTILGMKRREIDRKFADIAAFAEVERFLDTPVKRYSSGMYVRLAFAVAAHLDADVLVVDEVLAVGDLAFQRKSLGKMEDVAKSGRTVLFVSHNLGAVRTLCSSVLLLERGRVSFRGPTDEGLRRYEDSLLETGAAIASMRFSGPLADRVRFTSLALRQGGEEVAVLDPTLPVEVEMGGEASEEIGTLELNLGVSRDGVRLFSCHDAPPGAVMRQGGFRSHFEIAAGTLRPGRYVIGVGAYRPGGGDWTWCPDVTVVEVSERWSPLVQSRDLGLMSVPYQAERRQ